MIVPMKKAFVIVQTKDASTAVNRLGQLGIIHVEYDVPPASKGIAALKDEINTVASAINILDNPAYKKEFSAKSEKALDWKFAATHVVDIARRLEQLSAYSRVLNAQIGEWERWGDFNPEEIEKLRAKGVNIGFFQIPVGQIKQIPEGASAREIFRRAGNAFFVVISQAKLALPFKEIPLPKMGLEKMRSRLYEDQRLREMMLDDLGGYVGQLSFLRDVKSGLESQLEFAEAAAGMGRQESMAYLSGYIPFDQVEKLAVTARQEKWGLFVRGINRNDSPPVLLRNPRWIRLIQPVMKMLGIAPGYRELDVSPVFIVFFSIFFGILIGDAGYGLVYFLLALWFQKIKGTAKNANIFYLFYVLSGSAIVWGILTATFFGQTWLIARGVKPLVPALNEPVIMQKFCFFLGALHLTIAHGWRALLKLPGLNTLADIGWIAILWVSYYLAGNLILGEQIPAFGLPAAVIGIILVLFFSEPNKNPLKSFSAGFMSVTFGLGFMSAFTDVVSYVRLFAVGLAAVAIANTTNDMAAGLGGSAVGIMAGVLIVVIGHALNVVLGPIAILVHGVRLNVLEFGLNHASLTWSGSEYKPLKGSV